MNGAPTSLTIGDWLCHGDTTPDFEAVTTGSPVGFHDWMGGSRAVFFFHPEGLHPISTTELGYMAKIKAGEARRAVGRPGRQARQLGRGDQGDPGERRTTR
jgi:hypothetical protein